MAGVFLTAFALMGSIGGTFAERYAWAQFGPGLVDEALERRGRPLDGTIMSSDAYDSGWLVSYEYFYDHTLEVGYQRVTPEQGRRLRFGATVQIEALEHDLAGAQFPASSRLRGTVREPQAWITQLLQGSRIPRLALSLVAGLIGLWWLLRPPSRKTPML